MPLRSSLAGSDGPILFLDSGIGGLPYLELARRRLPGEEFVYLADTANFPYGEKSRARVIAAVVEAAGRGIQAFEPRAVVVACNTASVVALSALRERFGLPFVGTVPAIKPAALLSRNRRVGLLATRRTVQARYLKAMIRSFASGCKVVLVPASGVVDFVERCYFAASTEERRAIAERAVGVVRRRGVDVVVLACTHFLHLESDFRTALGEQVAVVDSRDGVARQLERILAAAGPRGDRGEGARASRLYVTRREGVESRYRMFCERYGLEYAGQIP
jgi:glutamate racemase